MIKTNRQTLTCRCGAYRFPHRAGSGHCLHDGDDLAPCCRACGSTSLTIDPPEPGNGMRDTIRCLSCGEEDNAALNIHNIGEAISHYELRAYAPDLGE